MSLKAMMAIKHLTHTEGGRKITPSEKGLLMQMADDHNEDRGCCWPSIPKLAVRVGLSEKQCRRLVQTLEKDQLIESRARLKDDGGRLSSEYRFWFDQPFDKASTKSVAKKLQYQEHRAATRPAQLRFNTPLPPVGGGASRPRPPHPDASVRPPLPPKAATPLPSMGGLELPVKRPKTDSSNPQENVTDGALYIDDVGHGDERFAACIQVAAQWVADRSAISDVRLIDTIAKAMAQHCRMQRKGAKSAAELMDKNLVTYQNEAAAGMLRIQFGLDKFFGQGHWQFPATWPYDEAKLAARSRASVGTFRG